MGPAFRRSKGELHIAVWEGIWRRVANRLPIIFASLTGRCSTLTKQQEPALSSAHGNKYLLPTGSQLSWQYFKYIEFPGQQAYIPIALQ